MECLGPQCASMLLEWIKARAAGPDGELVQVADPLERKAEALPVGRRPRPPEKLVPHPELDGGITHRHGLIGPPD